MKWTDYRELSVQDRRNRLADRLKADCDVALTNWNSDFPTIQVSKNRLTHFALLAMQLRSAQSLLKDPVTNPPSESNASPRAWAREPYIAFPDVVLPFASSEMPETKGECFVSELASLGPLAWGWRSPAESGEKAKGALRRGMLQILHDHWAAFDKDQIVLFLDSIELKDKTVAEVAREYVEWSGTKDSVETIAGVISDRIGRLDPR